MSNLTIRICTRSDYGKWAVRFIHQIRANPEDHMPVLTRMKPFTFERTFENKDLMAGYILGMKDGVPDAVFVPEELITILQTIK